MAFKCTVWQQKWPQVDLFVLHKIVQVQAQHATLQKCHSAAHLAGWAMQGVYANFTPADAQQNSIVQRRYVT